MTQTENSKFKNKLKIIDAQNQPLISFGKSYINTVPKVFNQ